MNEIATTIKTGRKNAKKISHLNRLARKSINDSNLDGDCIINVGNGYYRPDVEDAEDMREFEIYIAKQKSQAMNLLYKISQMEKCIIREQIEQGVEPSILKEEA